MESMTWWMPLQGPGLEQLHLAENETGVVANSVVLGTNDTTPFRLWYQVRIDQAWHVRECTLRAGIGLERTMHLRTNGRGHWTNAEGRTDANLNGCLDIDINCTPFTNTLPVRRLALAPGESAELLVTYITVPDLSVRPMRQRYTCIEDGLYRYESLESTFTADLPVDAQGLVMDYPGIWKRVQ